LDLIERRLFGFKNVNQIHLNLSLHLSALHFASLAPHLCAAITRHSTDKEQRWKRQEREREEREETGGRVAHFIACILNKCSLRSCANFSAYATLGKQKALDIGRHSLLLD